MATLPFAAGRIAPLNPKAGEEFLFHRQLNDQSAVTNLGPFNIRRRHASSYVQVPVALSDHVPEEWKMNSPAEISCECIIVGNAKNDVTASLRRLKSYMRKGVGGEPPELLFAVGADSWNVRMMTCEETPTLWDPGNGKEIRCKVTLTFHTLRSWST